MNKKSVPYLFIAILIVLLFFILGFRAGQQVEKTNKKTAAILSIAPTATLAPTRPPLGFETYTHAACGLQFLLPKTFEAARESSSGALFKEGKTAKLSFDCTGSDSASSGSNRENIVFQKLPVSAGINNGMYLFEMKHKLSSKTILFSVEKAYFPLLEKTLEFIK